MRILYYDCFSGISGDMHLGAMLDLGVPLEHLRTELAKLSLDGEFSLEITPASKHGIGGTKVTVHLEHAHHDHHHHRHYTDICALITNSTLPQKTKNRALKIFETLGRAEAGVHGVALDEVTFHEVGAVDAIVDIVGAAICLEALNIDHVFTSPIELGGGFVTCAHGTLPVPAPATLALLKHFPVTFGRVPFETATPTGAAIVASFAASFAPLPPLHVEKVGYGVGERDLDIPNLLRVVLGHIEPTMEIKKEILLETNIDDMSPERLAYAQEKFYEAGALDVFTTPICTKKNRLGTMLSVLCVLEKESLLTSLIFKETSSIGLRRHEVTKIALLRETRLVQTPYGEVEVKCVTPPGSSLRYKAEFDTCRALAHQHGVDIQTLYDAVATAMESS